MCRAWRGQANLATNWAHRTHLQTCGLDSQHQPFAALHGTTGLHFQRSNLVRACVLHLHRPHNLDVPRLRSEVSMYNSPPIVGTGQQGMLGFLRGLRPSNMEPSGSPSHVGDCLNVNLRDSQVQELRRPPSRTAATHLAWQLWLPTYCHKKGSQPPCSVETRKQ